MPETDLIARIDKLQRSFRSRQVPGHTDANATSFLMHVVTTTSDVKKLKEQATPQGPIEPVEKQLLEQVKNISFESIKPAPDEAEQLYLLNIYLALDLPEKANAAQFLELLTTFRDGSSAKKRLVQYLQGHYPATYQLHLVMNALKSAKEGDVQPLLNLLQTLIPGSEAQRRLVDYIAVKYPTLDPTLKIGNKNLLQIALEAQSAKSIANLSVVNPDYFLEIISAVQIQRIIKTWQDAVADHEIVSYQRKVLITELIENSKYLGIDQFTEQIIAKQIIMPAPPSTASEEEVNEYYKQRTANLREIIAEAERLFKEKFPGPLTITDDIRGAFYDLIVKNPLFNPYYRIKIVTGDKTHFLSMNSFVHKELIGSGNYGSVNRAEIVLPDDADTDLIDYLKKYALETTDKNGKKHYWIAIKFAHANNTEFQAECAAIDGISQLEQDLQNSKHNVGFSFDLHKDGTAEDIVSGNGIVSRLEAYDWNEDGVPNTTDANKFVRTVSSAERLNIPGIDAKVRQAINAKGYMLATIYTSLHALHEKGVVHLDLALRNVFIAKQFKGVVADFGNAHRLTDANTYAISHNNVLPILWSDPARLFVIQNEDPNQPNEHHVSVLSDLYSYRIILFEMMAIELNINLSQILKTPSGSTDRSDIGMFVRDNPIEIVMQQFIKNANEEIQKSNDPIGKRNAKMLVDCFKIYIQNNPNYWAKETEEIKQDRNSDAQMVSDAFDEYFKSHLLLLLANFKPESDQAEFKIKLQQLLMMVQEDFAVAKQLQIVDLIKKCETIIETPGDITSAVSELRKLDLLRYRQDEMIQANIQEGTEELERLLDAMEHLFKSDVDWESNAAINLNDVLAVQRADLDWDKVNIALPDLNWRIAQLDNLVDDFVSPDMRAEISMFKERIENPAAQKQLQLLKQLKEEIRAPEFAATKKQIDEFYATYKKLLEKFENKKRKFTRADFGYALGLITNIQALLIKLINVDNEGQEGYKLKNQLLAQFEADIKGPWARASKTHIRYEPIWNEFQKIDFVQDFSAERIDSQNVKAAFDKLSKLKTAHPALDFTSQLKVTLESFASINASQASYSELISKKLNVTNLRNKIAKLIEENDNVALSDLRKQLQEAKTALSNLQIAYSDLPQNFKLHQIDMELPSDAKARIKTIFALAAVRGDLDFQDITKERLADLVTLLDGKTEKKIADLIKLIDDSFGESKEEKQELAMGRTRISERVTPAKYVQDRLKALNSSFQNGENVSAELNRLISAEIYQKVIATDSVAHEMFFHLYRLSVQQTTHALIDLDKKLFTQINAYDFYKDKRTEEDSLIRADSTLMSIQHYVINEVLSKKDLHERTATIEFLINVANESITNNDIRSLNVACAIVSALHHPDIARLTTSFAGLSDSAKHTLEYIDSIIKNDSISREMSTASTVPTIPYYEAVKTEFAELRNDDPHKIQEVGIDKLAQGQVLLSRFQQAQRRIGKIDIDDENLKSFEEHVTKSRLPVDTSGISFTLEPSVQEQKRRFLRRKQPAIKPSTVVSAMIEMAKGLKPLTENMYVRKPVELLDLSKRLIVLTKETLHHFDSLSKNSDYAFAYVGAPDDVIPENQSIVRANIKQEDLQQFLQDVDSQEKNRYTERYYAQIASVAYNEKNPETPISLGNTLVIASLGQRVLDNSPSIHIKDPKQLSELSALDRVIALTVQALQNPDLFNIKPEEGVAHAKQNRIDIFNSLIDQLSPFALSEYKKYVSQKNPSAAAGTILESLPKDVAQHFTKIDNFYGNAPRFAKYPTKIELAKHLSRSMDSFRRVGDKPGGANKPGMYGGVYEFVFYAPDEDDPNGEPRLHRHKILFKQDTHKKTIRHDKNIGEFATGRLMNALIGDSAAAIIFATAPGHKGLPDETGENIYVGSIFVHQKYTDFFKIMGQKKRYRLHEKWFAKQYKEALCYKNSEGKYEPKYENVFAIMAASLLTGNFDLHSGNFGNTPTRYDTSKLGWLATLDFAAGTAYLEDELHIHSSSRHRLWAGPLNHFLDFPRELKVNPYFADELERQSQRDLRPEIDGIVAELRTFLGPNPIIDYAARSGMDVREYRQKVIDAGSDKAKRALIKEEVLSDIHDYLTYRMDKRQHQSAPRLAMEIRLSLCLPYDKETKQFKIEEVHYTTERTPYQEKSIHKNISILELIKSDPLYFFKSDYHFRSQEHATEIFGFRFQTANTYNQLVSLVNTSVLQVLPGIVKEMVRDNDLQKFEYLRNNSALSAEVEKNPDLYNQVRDGYKQVLQNVSNELSEISRDIFSSDAKTAEEAAKNFRVNLSQRIQTDFLMEKHFEERTLVLDRYIQLMQMAYDKGDMQSALALYQGIMNPAISTFKNNFDALPENTKQILTTMRHLFGEPLDERKVSDFMVYSMHSDKPVIPAVEYLPKVETSQANAFDGKIYPLGDIQAKRQELIGKMPASPLSAESKPYFDAAKMKAKPETLRINPYQIKFLDQNPPKKKTVAAPLLEEKKISAPLTEQERKEAKEAKKVKEPVKEESKKVKGDGEAKKSSTEKAPQFYSQETQLILAIESLKRLEEDVGRVQAASNDVFRALDALKKNALKNHSMFAPSPSRPSADAPKETVKDREAHLK